MRRPWTASHEIILVVFLSTYIIKKLLDFAELNYHTSTQPSHYRAVEMVIFWLEFRKTFNMDGD